MLKSNLCGYSDAYILVKETITVPNTTATAAEANNANKKVIFKNCAPVTECISEKDNTQIDKTKDNDVVMSMHNLIEYGDNYRKTSASLWQYYRNEAALDDAGRIVGFPNDNNSASFKFKQKITGQRGNDGTKDVQIMVKLKYMNNFWRTTEMPSVNCEINLFLTWSVNCFIRASAIHNQELTFAITVTTLYVSVVILSTQNNVKLLLQLKSCFKQQLTGINNNQNH